MGTVPKKIIIAAGGTGGHIFPALSVALELKKRNPDVSLLWIGTARSRERELCERYHIPLKTLAVSGMKRKASFGALKSLGQFGIQLLGMFSLFGRDRPDAVIAFGGYVSAPVLMAARLRRIPYYCHEQNTVAGMVNKMFAPNAQTMFLSFPLNNGWKPPLHTVISGMPVRENNNIDWRTFNYPDGVDRNKRTILICGGSQGALMMNRSLFGCVEKWASEGYQIIWQTGDASFDEVYKKMAAYRWVFPYRSISDLYPYYALCKVVVGRAGASTLAEVAYFGKPCVLVPLPWAAENHQWKNAGLVESQGWGIRVAQDDSCGQNVSAAVKKILGVESLAAEMGKKALAHSPQNAASSMVNKIMEQRN